MSTRTEVNFLRLLSRCEAMAADKLFDDWRLEKYIACLQDQLKEMHKFSTKPRQESLIEYTRKVNFLKGLMETEKMPTAAEKVLAAERLAPSSSSAEKSAPSRRLHIQSKARYHKEMREELLGTDSTKDTLRHRGGPGASEQEEDIDAVLRHHNQLQEKVAEEMVHLAKTMKENALTAGKIVREDTKRIGESTKIADTNFQRLEVQSKRLEAHVAKSCNWWIWIMLILVCATFVWMVIFMRLFPKR